MKSHPSKVLVIGDICLDKFIEGSVERISPEAPVPIFRYLKEKKYLGCSANVALSLSKFDISVDLISIISDDKNGNNILNMLESEKINIKYMLKTKHNNLIFTSMKTRIVSNSHHICRIDKEPDRFNLEKIIEKQLPDKIISALKENNYQYIVVSDYAKGVITNSIFDLITSLSEAPIITDPKPISRLKYSFSTILKPNLDEIKIILNNYFKINLISLDDIFKYSKKYMNLEKIKNIIITAGSKGSFLITENQVSHYKAEEVEVFDVSGAGDSFLAALIISLCYGNTISKAIEVANIAAAKTLTFSGTTALNKEFIEKLI